MSFLQLQPSSSFRVINKTLHKTSLPSESYVLSLASVARSYAALASTPSNQIHLFDKATLQSTCILRGHEYATTQLRTVRCLGASTREMLLSSGRDGCVIAWDERSGSVGVKMESSGKPHPLLCCDASDDGSLVAAGTDLQKEDAFIIYWDPRNPVAKLRSHGSTHSDDITAVHFSKGEHRSSSSNILLSTSSDGLISTSNALETDEDNAVMHVGNWGCSVSQGGWIYNRHGTRIWAASDMETFSCWSTELDQVLTVDIRSPSLHDHGHTWATDYLITGYSARKVESGFGLFVGSNEGDLALITGTDLSDATAPWMIHSVWAGGHSGVVRSLYWDEEHNIIITGGEDSNIAVWQNQIPDSEPPAPALNQANDLMEAEGPTFKRGWDGTMEVEQSFPDSKRVKES